MCAEGGAQVAAVVELGAGRVAGRASAEEHRAAHVEHERGHQVRLVLEYAHVGAAGAAEHLPVQAAHVVAGAVLAVLAELRGAAQMARAVAAGVGALDHVLGAEAQVGAAGSARPSPESGSASSARTRAPPLLGHLLEHVD